MTKRMLGMLLVLVVLIGMTGCIGKTAGETEAAETVSRQGSIHGNQANGEVHQHVYSITTVQATCRTEGYTKYTCTICGDSYLGEIIPAGDHDYSVNVVETGDGSGHRKVYTCRICGYSYTETDEHREN